MYWWCVPRYCWVNAGAPGSAKRWAKPVGPTEEVHRRVGIYTRCSDLRAGVTTGPLRYVLCAATGAVEMGRKEERMLDTSLLTSH